MVNIKITAGVFGWNHGKYELVKAGAPPIEVDDILAERLVAKGVAAYVTPSVVAETPDLPEETVPEYSTRNTVKELQAIAAQWGITFEEGATKAQMVEVLDQYLTESDTEAAPVFDAAEAVQ